MSMRFVNDRLTICEILRKINDRVQDESMSDVRDMLALAERMAKHIVDKLREYNVRDDPEWWAANKEYQDVIERDLASYIVGDAKKAEERLLKGG